MKGHLEDCRGLAQPSSHALSAPVTGPEVWGRWGCGKGTRLIQHSHPEQPEVPRYPRLTGLCHHSLVVLLVRQRHLHPPQQVDPVEAVPPGWLEATKGPPPSSNAGAVEERLGLERAQRTGVRHLPPSRPQVGRHLGPEPWWH